jgi:hypothetical protein
VQSRLAEAQQNLEQVQQRYGSELGSSPAYAAVQQAFSATRGAPAGGKTVF